MVVIALGVVVDAEEVAQLDRVVPTDRELAVDAAWRFVGFDVADAPGEGISGLCNCGYDPEDEALVARATWAPRFERARVVRPCRRCCRLSPALRSTRLRARAVLRRRHLDRRLSRPLLARACSTPRRSLDYRAVVDETKLKEKLRLIEALFAGATTDGERMAAAEAKKRIQLRLAGIEKTDPPIEFRLSLQDAWARKVLRALLRRYDLKPYRYRGQRHTTIMVRVSSSFMKETLWPEYEQIASVMRSFIEETTDRVIAESIHADSSDVTELAEPAQLSAGGSRDG